MRIMNFKKWLFEIDYLSIGHSFGNFDSWVLKRNRDDIQIASQAGKDPEYFHDNLRRFDCKGRIDHDKKQISMVVEDGDRERLSYAARLLKMQFPNYQIWLFSYGKPEQLA